MTAPQHAVAHDAVSPSTAPDGDGEALSPSLFAERLEAWLDRVLPPADAAPEPLHRAMRHAVFPGGKRLRPRLLLLVAAACSASHAEIELALRAACAVELIHAASLVHDDLPCFDDAAERRGQPSVHAVAGDAMAVLAGDALLSLAFEILAEAPPRMATRTLKITRLLAQATGSASGIIGGQSLEIVAGRGAAGGFSPEQIERYHAMKTGALFRLAAEAGAIAAGAAGCAAWADVGQLVGAWYQMADDLLDARAAAAVIGKPVGRDAALGRPSAVLCHGEDRVHARMAILLEEIRAHVARLAVAPRPLIALVEEVHHHIARAVGAEAP